MSAGELFAWAETQAATTQPATRADQLLAAFCRFHEDNPGVWLLFQRFAFEAIASGRKHYGATAIMERIRWHSQIETRGGELKLNDHHKPYYARMFHLAHPEHDGFFRNRKLTSEDEAAFANDVQVFHSGPPGEEKAITAKLEELLRKTPGGSPPGAGAPP